VKDENSYETFARVWRVLSKSDEASSSECAESES
jgi:hypothetical protein